jgi:uncharacterized membrane protein
MIYKRKQTLAIFILSLIGILLTSLLVKSKYLNEKTFCLTGSSCDLVSNSIYSEIVGIPVCVFGLIWFLITAYLAIRLSNKKNVFLSKYLMYWSVLGILFVGYFLFVEAFLINAFCSTCTAVHILIGIIFLLSYSIFRKTS